MEALKEHAYYDGMKSMVRMYHKIEEIENVLSGTEERGIVYEVF